MREAQARKLAPSKTLATPKIAKQNSNASPSIQKMILTTCAACAAPLAHDAPRCVRCWTRYLGDAADATLDDLVQAEALLDDTYTRFRRVMGDGHPDTSTIHKCLLDIRGLLARARASSHA